ncbi:MAG: hypothetical protein IKI00_09350 [Bacteroidales bacterium]|nr:hypothetical protein [Bacteroidales bacterium]
MKKIAFMVVCAIALSSCGTINLTERLVLPAYVDFDTYLSEGFYLNPNPYNGECEILGELEIIVQPAIRELYVKYGYEKGDDGKKHYVEEIVSPGTRGAVKKNAEEDITRAELIEIAVAEAKKKGANGFVDYHITVQSKAVSQGNMHNTYSISGLCIKK